ncbi:DUF6714 family protein [Archangium sp.]|jgi:hypothetical protein|uniref:DUF6714 family protein n=1 Tax=Archangium sp. TaxID=1872627 RepID=UPI002EDA2092
MPRTARVRLAPPLLVAAVLSLACEKKSAPPPVPLAEHGGYKPLSTRNPSRMQALRQEIAAAFADVPYPGDDALVDGDNPYDLESVALVEAFKGKHWKQLTPRELRYNELAFLSREALQFYLPAYLIGSLYDYGETTYGDILPSTVLSLLPPDGNTAEDQMLRQRELKRFAVFTPPQKRAIRSFLEYVRDELPEQGDEPRKALELYWGRN